MCESNEKSKIYFIHEVPTVWNIIDCNYLKSHRILGNFIGPPPKFAEERNQFKLPLRLMEVEAKLLQEKNLVEIVDFPATEELLKLLESDEFKKKYIERQKIVNEVYNEKALQQRKDEIMMVAEKIFKGKVKKCQSSGESCKLTIEDVIADEFDKASKKKSEFFEIYMENPFINDIPFKTKQWNFPETDKEKLHYIVFKSLWEKDLHITSGAKFGGDYLAYHGHPDSYHASFIIKCIDDKEEINTCDMVAWIRVGTITKKTFVFASLDEKNDVHYQSFQWGNQDLNVE